MNRYTYLDEDGEQDVMVLPTRFTEADHPDTIRGHWDANYAPQYGPLVEVAMPDFSDWLPIYTARRA